MAISTNYGWAEPDNSSLVKNGASDMRTLGNAIDTSLWNSGFGQAGKNKVINGNFGIWQRGTSFAPSAAGFYYTADRWVTYNYSTSATTVSQQSFTAGTAPVAGYESQYFLRITSTNTAAYIETRIEDVRTFAGQTATLSFWAKSASAQTLSTFKLYQAFGSGGSANVDINGTAPTLTTSWARYSYTFTVPSIAGKTIGTNSSLTIGLAGAINNALDIWGVQLEAGSTATPFQTASGGTQQAELAMCQRYYEKTYDITTAPGTNTTTGAFYATQSSDNGANSVYNTRFKVEKRNTSYAIAYYTTAGTATKWQYARSGVALTDAVITNLYSGTSGLSAYTSVGASWTSNQLVGHWVVDNEL